MKDLSRLSPLLMTFGGPVISSWLLVCSLPPSTTPWLGWFALVPFALVATVPAPWAEKALGALLGGLCLHYVGLGWVRRAFLVSDVHGSQASALLLLCLFGGASWPVALLFYSKLLKWVQPFLALPIAWVAGEYLRYFGFSAFGGNGFPVLQAGHSQISDLAIAQLAAVSGVWGVTAMLALVAGALTECAYRLLADPRWNLRVAVGRLVPAAIVLLVAQIYGLLRTTMTDVRRNGPVICLMSAFDPSFEKLISQECTADCEGPEADESLRNNPSSLNGPSADAELLLWPEGSLRSKFCIDRPEGMIRRNDVVRALERISARLGQSLVTTGIRYDARANREFNSAVVICPQRGLLGVYDKMCLVPFAEFQPNWLPLLTVSDRSPINVGERTSVFEISVTRIAQGKKPFSGVGILICYDVLFPDCTRAWIDDEPRGAAPECFLVASSEACDPQGQLSAQVQALARFRAIETGRGIVRNTDSGWCGVIDPLGREIECASNPSRDGPQIVGRAPSSTHQSLYAKFGDWFPTMCAALSFTACIAPGNFGRRARRQVW